MGKWLSKFLSKKLFEIIKTNDKDRIDLSRINSVMSIPKADVIIHLASKSFIPDSFRDPKNFYTNNFLSTLNILEKARIDKSKVIFFSTYVYGDPKYLPIDEAHATNPLNPYTQSKLVSEDLCIAYNRDFGIPITIFRPFNIYGLGQNPSFFIPTIINQLNDQIIELNDSRPKRDFIHIDDVVKAVYLAIKSNDSKAKIFNLGSGTSTSVKEIVKIIMKFSPKKPIVKFSEEVRKGEILDTVADISKIKNELEWQPNIPLKEGLRSLIISEDQFLNQ